MTRGLDAIPGVEVFPVDLRGGPLRVCVSDSLAPTNTRAVDEEWARLRRENPRYFDGSLLSVLHLGPGDASNPINEILVRRDRFSRLAVQPAVSTCVRILSVTGVLTAHDASGREHVLLGRRGAGTRVYPDMWELGPSGGLHDPAPGVRELDEGAIFSSLCDEVSEEIGLELERGTAVAVARDNIAMSDDIVFVCELGRLEDVRDRAGPANWEYARTLWVPLDSVQVFEDQHGAEVIAPTRALFRSLGWIEWT
jgi:hypothetical protein